MHACDDKSGRRWDSAAFNQDAYNALVFVLFYDRPRIDSAIANGLERPIAMELYLAESSILFPDFCY
ncbi:hypothetical protein IV77_GL001114 [Olsenella uli DSM 7084]|nr:hypothetical protein IV77_GL001114 [Olsenella uli DSM 7084]